MLVSMGAVVTPYAGVWIEIEIFLNTVVPASSLPTRECGLKYSETKGGI